MTTETDTNDEQHEEVDGNQQPSPDVEVPEGRSMEHPRPWTNEEFLRELYHGQTMTATAIANYWDCAQSTISNWLDNHGIEKRSRSEAMSIGYGTYRKIPFQTRYNGYEQWYHARRSIDVHRLLAVAEYGVEEVAGAYVHHKNRIPWDNRPENIEVFQENGEHSRQHKKFTGFRRIRTAELYEGGDCGSRTVAEELPFDISCTTVLDIHDEFYGGEAA